MKFLIKWLKRVKGLIKKFFDKKIPGEEKYLKTYWVFLFCGEGQLG